MLQDQILIRRKMNETIKARAELNIEMNYIQYHCKHPNVKTGLLAHTDGVLEHICQDCDKYWLETL